MSVYFDALCGAMSVLADEPRVVFVGQAVGSDGTAMRGTLRHLPPDRLLEFPVAEDMQLGFCTGLALAGLIPVCIFPRINFMLLAVSQLVLHLDKIPYYSAYRPGVIIRTAVATVVPLDPGPQHLGDYTSAVKIMLGSVRVYTPSSAPEVRHCYGNALAYARRGGSTLLVERMGLYSSPP